MCDSSRVLTCVYCGMAYPQGTPASGSKVLTDHIKVCPKHPLRAAEETIAKLRSALVGLVGADGKEELEGMEAMIRTMSAMGSIPGKDAAATINAIHALLETSKEIAADTMEGGGVQQATPACQNAAGH
jgi:hypothetical protein